MREVEVTSYPWQSSVLYAATLDADGMVQSANRALLEGVGAPLLDGPFSAALTPEQHDAFIAWLLEADEEWRSGTFGLRDLNGGPAEDRLLWVRRGGEDLIELIGEPAWQDQSHLVEQVLQLNDDLISTQRHLHRRQRQLEQAQGEAQGAILRANDLESVLLASMAHSDPDRALQELLTTAQQLLPGERADLLLVDETLESLTLRASAGGPNLIDPRPLIKLGVGILGRIAVTGESRLVDDLAAASERLGASGSLIGVALRVDERIAGVLAVRAAAPHAFTRSHVRLLEVVSERLALAVGHAQLRERERRMAEILQRTLLPQRLPEVAGIEISAHYEGRAASVGGDFYDAITLPDGRIAVAIGDVMGKGLRAAAAMAHLRAGIHALAIDGSGPGEVLLRLGRMAEADGHFATAVLLLLDPATGVLALANAGHLPPLLVQDGVADFLDPPGSRSALLGLAVDRRGEAALQLTPGGTLVLYTDGLVESTRDIDEGMARLRATASTCVDCTPEELCDHLLTALSPTGAYRDDVTLIAVRRR
ncbi:MAG TPA: GAF domain-containing SpoIIE family protein phosphatase [Solirubrobacteraceae bacterium]|nr:GAF domain-containing SpoIIE family protein phosphatase [Solirubrobacteraceae bacterium]